jgi:hypothetical protein
MPTNKNPGSQAQALNIFAPCWLDITQCGIRYQIGVVDLRDALYTNIAGPENIMAKCRTCGSRE